MAKCKLSIKEFQRSLQEYIANLRQTIEAECLGFDVNPQATQARRAAVCDPVTGYDYFVENYFPHYVRNPAKSELHKYLFSRLPQVVASPDRRTTPSPRPVVKQNPRW